MTELQVKTKKGSLKKFLAMFLAFCVCATTVFVDGAFAQAAEGKGTTFNPNPVTVTAGNAAKLEVSLGEKETVSGDNAKVESGWNKVKGAEGITVSGEKNSEIDVNVASTVAAGNYEIDVLFAENVVTGDNASADVYRGSFAVSVKSSGGSTGGPEGNVTPEIAIREGQETVTLTKTAPSKNLKDSLTFENVSPDNAEITWTGGNDAVTVNDKGVVTATKNTTTAVTVKAALAGGNEVEFKVTATGFTTTPPPVVNAVTGVTVTPKTLALKVGGEGTVTVNVTVTGTAAKTVKWESSNPKVATVENGKVKAVAGGTANITATSTVDPTKKDTCVVTVTAADTTPTPPTTDSKKDDVAVSSITLNAKTVYLKTGAKLTVKAVVAPSNATNKTVTWSSNKKTIATVNKSGVITAKKKTGKAVITAKAGSKTAKVTVNVVKKAKKTSSIKLSKSKVTVKAKDQVALSATLSKGATSKVTWTTSNKKVATVKDGIVTAKKQGVVVITATADGKSADCVVTVTNASGKKVTTLKANTKKISVKVKKTKKIKVTPAKKDSVKSYVSSNKKVATVSKKGVVTGKKKGTATIIVTTKKGAVATIPVTVK